MQMPETVQLDPFEQLLQNQTQTSKQCALLTARAGLPRKRAHLGDREGSRGGDRQQDVSFKK